MPAPAETQPATGTVPAHEQKGTVMEMILEEAAPPTRSTGNTGSKWDDVIAHLASDENRGKWFKVGLNATRAQQAHLQRTAKGLGWYLRTQTEATEAGYDEDGHYAALYARIDCTVDEREADLAARKAKGEDVSADEAEDAAADGELEAEAEQTPAQKAKARAAAKKAAAQS